MAKIFIKKNYEWSLKGLENCIKENGLKSEIICVAKNAAIVNVTSYEDSQILGAHSKWCICFDYSSWNRYVLNDKRVQLFIYDFAKGYDSNYSMLGITFDVKSEKLVKAYCGFTKNDTPIKEAFDTNTDWEGAYNCISPIFGISADELFDVIKELHTEQYRKRKNKVEVENKKQPTPTLFMPDYELVFNPTSTESEAYDLVFLS